MGQCFNLHYGGIGVSEKKSQPINLPGGGGRTFFEVTYGPPAQGSTATGGKGKAGVAGPGLETGATSGRQGEGEEPGPRRDNWVQGFF